MRSADGDTAVRFELEGLPPGDVTAVANAVECFTIVLCDLELLLETGPSPGIVTDKPRLITLTAPRARCTSASST